MPAVLLQISLLTALLATLLTAYTAFTAGVTPLLIAIRSAAAFAMFFVLTAMTGKTLTLLMPEAWRGYRQPKQSPQIGRILDVTLPAVAPPAKAARTEPADQEG